MYVLRSRYLYLVGCSFEIQYDCRYVVSFSVLCFTSVVSLDCFFNCEFVDKILFESLRYFVQFFFLECWILIGLMLGGRWIGNKVSIRAFSFSIYTLT